MDNPSGHAVLTAVAMAATAIAMVAVIVDGKRKAELTSKAGPGRGAPGRKRRKKVVRDPWQPTYASLLKAEGVEDEGAAAGRRFRKTFRAPFTVYLSVLTIAKGVPYWARMKSAGAVGKGKCPIEM